MEVEAEGGRINLGLDGMKLTHDELSQLIALAKGERNANDYMV
jgi:hypothetical protein